jgi:hypothetical protein
MYFIEYFGPLFIFTMLYFYPELFYSEKEQRADADHQRYEIYIKFGRIAFFMLIGHYMKR